MSSNLGSLEGYLKDLFGILDAYAALEAAVPADHPALAVLLQLKASLDLPYMIEDVPALMNESHEGITRVRKIVQDLKDFSRVDGHTTWEIASLHRGIDSTLNIVANEIKYAAEIVKTTRTFPTSSACPRN